MLITHDLGKRIEWIYRFELVTDGRTDLAGLDRVIDCIWTDGRANERTKVD